MFDYETFAYLDVQKTGFSFVAQMLATFSSERLVSGTQHARPARRDPGKFYFISCRDPLDQYLSLYFYGCQGRGHIRNRMKDSDAGAFYDGSAAGFEGFARHLLDPANQRLIRQDYVRSKLAPLAGMMTFRFLVLAIPDAIPLMAACRAPGDVLAMYRRHGIADAVIRTETLNEDLKALVRGPLRHRLRDPEAAVAWIEGAERCNQSDRRDRAEDGFTVDAGTLRLIEAREWFLFDVLGYPRYAAAAGEAAPAAMLPAGRS